MGGCCLTFLPHLLHSPPENSTLLVAQTSHFAYAFHSLAHSIHLAALSPTLSAAIITSSAQLLMWCSCSKFFNGSFGQQVKGPNSTSKFIGPLYCGPNLPFHTLPNFLTHSLPSNSIILNAFSYFYAFDLLMSLCFNPLPLSLKVYASPLLDTHSSIFFKEPPLMPRVFPHSSQVGLGAPLGFCCTFFPYVITLLQVFISMLRD